MTKTTIQEEHLTRLKTLYDLKVFAVLKLFNTYELNRFAKFVNSPYFNRNERLVRLFDKIHEYLRNSDPEFTPDRESLWRYAAKEADFDDVRFRKMCSDLLKLIERFLAQEEFERNSLHRADYLLQAIFEKSLEPLYNSSVRTAQRLSDQYFLRPASYYFYQYAFERSIYSMKGFEIDRSRTINVEQISENLDKFYLAEKLRYYCYALHRQPHTDHKYNFWFIEEIIDHIDKMGYIDIVPINFYYQIYLTLKEPDNLEYYHVLKQLITEYIDQLPSLEAKEVMDAAFNFCIKKINAGNRQFVSEIFDLYKASLRNQLIYVNGMLDPWNFRNIIVSGLRLGEYKWVEDFIDNYQDHVDERYRANAVSFNRANLYFYQKKYDDVMGLLQAVEYEDPAYNLNSKAMLIATYYELDEIEPLLSLLVSFSAYLRRRKGIAAKRRQHYQKLVKFVRAIIRTPASNKEALKALKDKIQSTQGVVNQAWLIEKIDELL